MLVHLGDTIESFFSTLTTASVQQDADSLPTAAVREGATDMGLSPAVTKVDTGYYRATIVATAGNGFEGGKYYTVEISATVDTVALKRAIDRFLCQAKLIDDLQDLAQSDILDDETPFSGAHIDAPISGCSTHGDPTSAIIGDPGKTNQEVYDNERGTDGAYTGTPPTAEGIADQVWDEARDEHVIAGSFGEKNQKGVPSETLDDYKADVADKPTLVEIEASSVLAKEATLITIDSNVDEVASDVLWLKKWEQSNAILSAAGIESHSDKDTDESLGDFEMRNRTGTPSDTNIVQRTWKE